MQGKIDQEEIDFEGWALDRLCQYIVSRHHTFTYQQMPVISALARKIAAEEGATYPKIYQLAYIFDRMAIDTRYHMEKEEKILFPFIEQLVEAAGESVKITRPFFGTVNNPAQIMKIEHEQAAEDMKEIRKLTDDYKLPEGAGQSIITLYRLLKEFEADLRTHVYLESKVLFPKAIELEKEIGLS